eukprot:941503-Pyramimonas_sp.AAC.1
MGRRGKDANVTLERMPIHTMRVDCAACAAGDAFMWRCAATTTCFGGCICNGYHVPIGSGARLEPWQ